MGAVDPNLACVGPLGAGKRLDEGRFPGSVPPDKSHDFTGKEVDGDVIDGVHAPEGDADVAHFDERRPVGHLSARLR
jgi:hypothetical protein